jgi:hypothetical protein
MVMVLAKGYADDSRKLAGTELLSVPQLVALAGSLNGRETVFPFVFSCGKAIDAPLFCGVTSYIWSR